MIRLKCQTVAGLLNFSSLVSPGSVDKMSEPRHKRKLYLNPHTESASTKCFAPVY